MFISDRTAVWVFGYRTYNIRVVQDFLEIKFAKVRVESANCKLQTYVQISKFGPFRPKLPPNFPQKLSEVRGGMWGRKISGEEVGNRGKREEEGT